MTNIDSDSSREWASQAYALLKKRHIVMKGVPPAPLLLGIYLMPKIHANDIQQIKELVKNIQKYF